MFYMDKMYSQTPYLCSCLVFEVYFFINVFFLSVLSYLNVFIWMYVKAVFFVLVVLFWVLFVPVGNLGIFLLMTGCSSPTADLWIVFYRWILADCCSFIIPQVGSILNKNTVFVFLLQRIFEE